MRAQQTSGEEGFLGPAEVFFQRRGPKIDPRQVGHNVLPKL